MFGPLYLVALTAVRPAPARRLLLLGGGECFDKPVLSLSKGSARTGLGGAGHWTLASIHRLFVRGPLALHDGEAIQTCALAAQLGALAQPEVTRATKRRSAVKQAFCRSIDWPYTMHIQQIEA